VSLCMTNVNALFVVNAPAVRTTLLVAVVMTADKLELLAGKEFHGLLAQRYIQ